MGWAGARNRADHAAGVKTETFTRGVLAGRAGAWAPRLRVRDPGAPRRPGSRRTRKPEDGAQPCA